MLLFIGSQWHWSPSSWVYCKIVIITYTVIRQQPTPLLVNDTPHWTLCSTVLLNIATSLTVIGARCFSSAAPVIWNNNPPSDVSSASNGTSIPDLRLTCLLALHHWPATLLLIHFEKSANNSTLHSSYSHQTMCTTVNSTQQVQTL